MARKQSNSNTDALQRTLFELAGDMPAVSTSRRIRYGDVFITAHTTHAGPLVGTATATDAQPQPGAPSATSAPAFETPTPTDAQPHPQIIAGMPDPQRPRRWHEYTAGRDANATRLRIEKLRAAVGRVLDVLTDYREHHAAEIYRAAGGLDPSRALRGVRELVARTDTGALVYAWVVLCRIDADTGAGVYRLQWRSTPQPRGDNGVGQ